MAREQAAALAGSGKLQELWSRILFVLGAFIVYRIGTHIPVPGVDPIAIAALFEQNRGSILDVLNMFSGGALSRLSILALGVMPYISASIIMQMLTAVEPRLKQVKQEGEAGRRKIQKWTLRSGSFGHVPGARCCEYGTRPAGWRRISYADYWLSIYYCLRIGTGRWHDVLGLAW